MLHPVLVACLALAAASTAEASTAVYVSFRTPSGNIGCAYSQLGGGKPELRCEIASGMKPVPPKPRSCDGLWGRGVGMAATGRPARTCLTDTVMDPHAKALAYGRTWRRGGLVCTSKAAGLTCRNGSAHGWFLSRARSRLF